MHLGPTIWCKCSKPNHQLIARKGLQSWFRQIANDMFILSTGKQNFKRQINVIRFV